jgi:hypothetical protein
MGYCSLDHVRTLLPAKTFDATSRPSESDVQVMIEAISAEVDGLIHGTYNVMVPVTQGPIALGYLKTLVGWGTAGTVELASVGGVSGAGDSGPGDTPRRSYWQIYQDRLKRLLDTEKGVLADAPVATTRVNVRPLMQSFFTKNPTDDRDVGMASRMKGTSAAARFDMDRQF